MTDNGYMNYYYRKIDNRTMTKSEWRRYRKLCETFHIPLRPILPKQFVYSLVFPIDYSTGAGRCTKKLRYIEA